MMALVVAMAGIMLPAIAAYINIHNYQEWLHYITLHLNYLEWSK